MLETIANDAALRFFEEISAIPRASYHEKEIADYIEEFAANRGLFCYRDAAHNVFVKKRATQGREHEPSVLLQAHTDMVAEKHSHIEHDFLREGIKLQCEGDRLFANGTTLGADDGFGVAIMLAVLDDNELSAPALECLFTSAEEVGLVGAGKFDYSRISAKYMLNLDSAEEDTVIVGCCGGVRSTLTVPVTFEHVPGQGITLSVGGLCGGHSGEDIHRNRLNANVLIGKLLVALREHTPFRLVDIKGGDKSNAIPRECKVTLLPDDIDAAHAFLEGGEALARSFICAKEDKGLTLAANVSGVTRVMSYADTDKILQVLQLPNGVLQMRKEPPIMPETSRNLASLRTDTDRVIIKLCARSPKPRRLLEIRGEEEALAKSVSGAVEYDNAYPGWESDMNAPLVHTWKKALYTVTGNRAEATLIHAGLETGLITNAVKGLEAIAVGCNIHDLHTPFETMEISSFLRISHTVKEFLRIINQ